MGACGLLTIIVRPAGSWSSCMAGETEATTYGDSPAPQPRTMTRLSPSPDFCQHSFAFFAVCVTEKENQRTRRQESSDLHADRVAVRRAAGDREPVELHRRERQQPAVHANRRLGRIRLVLGRGERRDHDDVVVLLLVGLDRTPPAQTDLAGFERLAAAEDCAFEPVVGCERRVFASQRVREARELLAQPRRVCLVGVASARGGRAFLDRRHHQRHVHVAGPRDRERERAVVRRLLLQLRVGVGCNSIQPNPIIHALTSAPRKNHRTNETTQARETAGGCSCIVSTHHVCEKREHAPVRMYSLPASLRGTAVKSAVSST
eukprot:3774921-Rhodomonas_salina.2